MQDWIRGKIPYYVAPPEPTDAAGKPIPRPLKLGSSSASTTVADDKPKATSVFDQVDENGNTTRRVPGVQQPLHQIVHSTKFLPDDVRRIEDDDEEDEAEGAEGADDTFEDDGEEWGGIAEDDGEAESLDEEEDEEDEGAADGDEAPLAWDELFAQAVGDVDEADSSEADAAVAAVVGDAALSDDDSDPEFTVEVEEEFDVNLDDEDDESLDGEEEFGTGDEDDVEIVVNGDAAGASKSAVAAAKAARKAPAGKKRSTSIFQRSSLAQNTDPALIPSARAIDAVSSDDESGSDRPVKEKRMTTNKKKATNFFTHANVKK